MKTIRKIISAAAIVMALVLLLSSTAFAYTGVATVATDDLNLREGASLDYNVIDCLPRGAKVIINFDAGYGWYQVTYNGQTGYMAGYYLLLGDLEEEEAKAAAAAAGQEYVPQTQNVAQVVTPAVTQTAEPAPAPVQTVTTTYTAPVTGSGSGSIRGTDVRLRSGPSMNSETITYLGNGTRISVHGACGAWYEVECNGNVGYVYGDYVVLSGQTVTYTMTAATTVESAAIYTEPVTEQTYVDPTPVAQTTVVETPASFVHNAAKGQSIVDTANRFAGTPYVWGGTSPTEGFDCSGFVYYVYGLHGYTLNRVAQAMYYNGVAADLNDLQPGDILLFGSSVYNIWHAGIYVGNGIFIHSPHSGQVVSTQALADTYGMRLVAARRIV